MIVTHCGSDIEGGDEKRAVDKVRQLAKERNVEVIVARDGVELVLEVIVACDGLELVLR